MAGAFYAGFQIENSSKIVGGDVIGVVFPILLVNYG